MWWQLPIPPQNLILLTEIMELSEDIYVLESIHLLVDCLDVVKPYATYFVLEFLVLESVV